MRRPDELEEQAKQHRLKAEECRQRVAERPSNDQWRASYLGLADTYELLAREAELLGRSWYILHGAD